MREKLNIKKYMQKLYMIKVLSGKMGNNCLYIVCINE